MSLPDYTHSRKMRRSNDIRASNALVSMYCDTQIRPKWSNTAIYNTELWSRRQRQRPPARRHTRGANTMQPVTQPQ